MKSVCIAAFAALLISATNAWTYEVNTHDRLSREAAKLSLLPTKLADLGLTDLNQNITVTDTSVTTGLLVFCEPLTTVVKRTVIDLLALGAVCEDSAHGTAQAFRFQNHFYDPQLSGQGLSIGGQHIDSLTWAVDPQNTLSTQEYSSRRAKTYLLSSFTLPNQIERQKSLGLLFRTLGHVMHLIQDLGNPSTPEMTRTDWCIDMKPTWILKMRTVD